MAWSDAARRAAAEVRKLHAKSKVRFTERELMEQTSYGPPQLPHRQETARQLRALRSGRKAHEAVLTSRGWEHDNLTAASVVRNARESTAARNYYYRGNLAERIKRLRRKF